MVKTKDLFMQEREEEYLSDEFSNFIRLRNVLHQYHDFTGNSKGHSETNKSGEKSKRKR